MQYILHLQDTQDQPHFKHLMVTHGDGIGYWLVQLQTKSPIGILIILLPLVGDVFEEEGGVGAEWGRMFEKSTTEYTEPADFACTLISLLSHSQEQTAQTSEDR